MIVEDFTNRLTIAIPAFERKDFFEEAISSALGQKIKCPLIVVDNASSHSYFKDYCQAHAITYFRNESNIGMFANWNKCIELASTDYVLILGDDDIIRSDYTTRFLEALNLFPQIDIYYTNFSILVNKTGELKDHQHTLPFGYSSKGSQIIESAIRYGLGFPIITSAIKKEIFSGFYTELHASNDWVWLYSKVHSLSCFGDISKLLFYRSHEKQNHSQLLTKVNCLLSMSYLYGIVLFQFVNDKDLLKSSKNRERNVILYLLSIAPSSYIDEIRINKNIYSNYFLELMKLNRRYFVFSRLPLSVRRFIYGVLRKTGIAKDI